LWTGIAITIRNRGVAAAGAFTVTIHKRRHDQRHEPALLHVSSQ
jgi:hypothetical protein